jgi:hypothetical protein
MKKFVAVIGLVLVAGLAFAGSSVFSYKTVTSSGVTNINLGTYNYPATEIEVIKVSTSPIYILWNGANAIASSTCSYLMDGSVASVIKQEAITTSMSINAGTNVPDIRIQVKK